jgi:uncharacterized membrane protein YfcA
MRHLRAVMPAVTPILSVFVFLAGALAGVLGALLGIGGGVFLVPFLTLVLSIPLRFAIPISLTTVIATSSAVSGGTAGKQLINMRLGMLLEVATAGGALVGGITAERVPIAVLYALFGIITSGSALAMLTRLGRRNVILGSSVESGRLGGRYYEQESGGTVTYRVRKLPLAMLASFIAGTVSSLLGVGGGVLKVPVLNNWCGGPLRAAAATSAFMIGVTATAGAVIYYERGQLTPSLAAAAVLGVLAGSAVSFRVAPRARARSLKVLMAVVLIIVAVLMFTRAC